MTYVAYGNTYPVREQLKALGGRWNTQTQHWEFTDEPTTQVEGIAFVPSPLPEGWDTSECFVKVGNIFQHPLWDETTDEHQQSAYAVSVATWDDKTFDTDEERWVNCSITLYRPLTDAEWEAEESARRKAKQVKETRRAFDALIHEKGSVIEGRLESLPEGERLVWPRRSQPDYVIRTADSIVVAYYNGASGDCWAWNNYSDYVVWSCPLSECEAAYNKLLSTFETEVK